MLSKFDSPGEVAEAHRIRNIVRRTLPLCSCGSAFVNRGFFKNPCGTMYLLLTKGSEECRLVYRNGRHIGGVAERLQKLLPCSNIQICHDVEEYWGT